MDGVNDHNFESLWTTSGPLPQSITIDLGAIYDGISIVDYLPKRFNRESTTSGDITSYRILVSADGKKFSRVAAGDWPANSKLKIAEFKPTKARFVRIEVIAASKATASASEFDIGGRLVVPKKLAH